MSRLEDAAKPILLPLMRGEACRVMTDQSLLVARWAVKTAIMWEYMRYDSGRFFKPRDRTAFFESLFIPKDTLVYAARYLDSPSTKTIGGPMELQLPNASTPTHAYSSTTVIGQLALQVFSFKRPEEHKSGIKVQVRGTWAEVAYQVWPLSGNWNWPPPKAIDDAGLRLFASRWLHDS